MSVQHSIMLIRANVCKKCRKDYWHCYCERYFYLRSYLDRHNITRDEFIKLIQHLP